VVSFWEPPPELLELAPPEVAPSGVDPVESEVEADVVGDAPDGADPESAGSDETEVFLVRLA
jgi:hypothetical protein